MPGEGGSSDCDIRMACNDWTSVILVLGPLPGGGDEWTEDKLRGQFRVSWDHREGLRSTPCTLPNTSSFTLHVHTVVLDCGALTQVGSKLWSKSTESLR